MGEVFGMWRNTRMVVLTAICAALYAATLIPFKVVPLIPGITEFRPANAVPPVCAVLFGPAAVWGAAFGNLIGDFFGGLGPGDLFGFAGNFCYALLPYKVCAPIAMADAAAVQRPLVLARFLAGTALGAALSATVIGGGLHVLGFHPFSVLGPLVLVNNLAVASVLSPLLLAVLAPRVARAGLGYRHVLGAGAPPPGRWRRGLGLGLVVLGTVGGFVAGELIATQRWTPPWVGFSTESLRWEIALGLPPFVLVALAGAWLL
jgi:energy-coupling factor transport system substrate-specific component